MATIPNKPAIDEGPQPVLPRGSERPTEVAGRPVPVDSAQSAQRPSSRDALQALLAFSALHDQVRRRKNLASKYSIFDLAPVAEFEPEEIFALDEVLQLVAERAVSITGSDGLAIALAENNEIVLRAAAGVVCPDVGARIDRDSAFSGACFRTAQVIRCDDTESDARVNVAACRRLGARSMVAVPLCGRRRVIGVLEAFSAEPMGFNESDVRNLELLAEIILGALKPEDEDRFAQSAGIAATALAPLASLTPPPVKVDPPVFTPSASVVKPSPSIPVGDLSHAKPADNYTPASVPVLAAPVKSFEATAKSEVPAEIPAATIPAIKEPEAVVNSNPPAIQTAAAPTDIAEAIPEPLAPPAPEDISAAGSVPSATAETLPASETHDTPSFASLDRTPEPLPPGIILLLVLVVVAAVAAGGIWWKVKTAQLGRAMIHQHKANVRHDAPAATSGDASASAATVAPVAQPANAQTDNPSLEAAPAGTAAATPQEMAHMPHVKGLRHWSSSDASTVVLDLDDQVQYEAHRLSGPERIYFDLHDTALAAPLANKVEEVGDALLSRVRLAQPVPGITRLVLETRGASSFSVSLEPSPYRLVVTIRKAGAAPQPRAELFPGQADAEAERRKLAIVIPPPAKEDLQLRAHVPKMRIVVDAGHGGWDLGTVGRKGLLEKDVALEVAQRLGKLLESRLGFAVLYTRSDDTYIALDQRAAVANQSQADLFISIHANYSDLPSARGVETYYSRSFASSAHATSTDAKALMPVMLSPADLREKVQDSARLASDVQHTLYATLAAQNPGIRDRGVKAAGFAVLTGTSMPGILAEISFVSSPADEQKLLNDGYREQIAEALYKGIARYAASAHGVKMASASAKNGTQ